LIKKLKRKIFRDERQLPAAADSQGDACGAPDQTVTPSKTFSVLDFFRSMFCFRPKPIRLDLDRPEKYKIEKYDPSSHFLPFSLSLNIN
jgi:hypothetical protein